jgi:hypothetical protein
MNNQNILKFFGSRLNLKLDSSEYYDYELSKIEGDYNTNVLDFSSPIIYDSLKVDDSLEDFCSNIIKIKLVEVDNSINDPDYIYSGLSAIFNYNDFTSHFNTTGYTYSHTILNNDVYTYIGISGEIHYFKIHSYFCDNIVIPENDFYYLIIPNNDVNNLIIPNNDFLHLLIPNNDFLHLLIPNNDLNYQIL